MIDILSGGKSTISGAMMALPEGGWGMPKEMVLALPGYGGDQAARQAEARRIMESLGYGPSKRLKVKVSTRDFQNFKDPAVLLVDQLNRIYFDAELRDHRVRRLVRPHHAAGLCGRPQPYGLRRRRPQRHPGRGLCLQVGPQLHQVLQPRGREAARGAVAGSRHRQAQGDRLADRAGAGRGRGAPHHLPRLRRDLLASSPQGPRAARELHLQQLAVRERLARQVGFGGAGCRRHARPACRASGSSASTISCSGRWACRRWATSAPT